MSPLDDSAQVGLGLQSKSGSIVTEATRPLVPSGTLLQYKILTYLSCVQYLYYWSSQKNVAGHTQVLTFLSNSIYSALYSRLMKSVNLLHYKIVTQKMAKRHLSFVNCHFDDVTFTEGLHITDKMKPNRARENEQLSQNMPFAFQSIL